MLADLLVIRCGCDECVTSRQEDSLRHSRSRINAYRQVKKQCWKWRRKGQGLRMQTISMNENSLHNARKYEPSFFWPRQTLYILWKKCEVQKIFLRFWTMQNLPQFKNVNFVKLHFENCSIFYFHCFFYLGKF